MRLRLILFLSLASTWFAAAANPAWKKELTSAAPGTFPAIPPGVLELQLTWKGMLNSGKVRMEFAPHDAKKPGTLVIRSSAVSLGAAATVFPYQNNCWSELNPSTLKPRFFHAVETDKKETVTTTTRHFTDRVESRETTQPLDKRAVSQRDRVFKFAPVFDIFSAMLHIRSQKLNTGDRVTLVVHPFGNPYLFNVKVQGREVHLDRKTIRLSVGMRKIDRKTHEVLPYKKMNSDATLWLSDDSDRIPVEFRAAVFIGDVRATLAGFQKS
jgi:hypothetical protein